MAPCSSSSGGSGSCGKRSSNGAVIPGVCSLVSSGGALYLLVARRCIHLHLQLGGKRHTLCGLRVEMCPVPAEA